MRVRCRLRCGYGSTVDTDDTYVYAAAVRYDTGSGSSARPLLVLGVVHTMLLIFLFFVVETLLPVVAIFHVLRHLIASLSLCRQTHV